MTTQQTDIEKTLKRILARELTEWPDNWKYCAQTWDGQIYFDNSEEDQENFRRGAFLTLAKDHETARISRVEWEVERALLASEQSQPLGDSEEFDQALWDRVAIAAAQAFITAHITHYGHGENVWTTEGLMSCAADNADTFMSERAKRIAARKAGA